MIVEPLLLLDEEVGGEPVLLVTPRGRLPLRRELHGRHQHPLEQREGDPDDGSHRDQDLRYHARQHRRPHWRFLSREVKRQLAVATSVKEVTDDERQVRGYTVTHIPGACQALYRRGRRSNDGGRGLMRKPNLTRGVFETMSMFITHTGISDPTQPSETVTLRHVKVDSSHAVSHLSFAISVQVARNSCHDY